jgi:hypothetical protein
VNPRIARAGAFFVVVAGLARMHGRTVRVGADFSAFLPAGANPGQRALVSAAARRRRRTPAADRARGDDPARLADASRALVQALAGRPEFRYAATATRAGSRATCNSLSRIATR